MGLEVVFEWRSLGWLTFGVASLVGLVWLLRSVPRSPLRNAFAVLLALFLLYAILVPFVWDVGDRQYFLADIPDNGYALATIFLLITWLAASRGNRLPRWLPLPFVVAGLAIQALYIAVPDWRSYTQDGVGHLGAIFAVENTFEVAVDALVAVLLRAAVRRDSLPLALAALGFLWVLVFGVFDIMSFLAGRLRDFWAGFPDGEMALQLLLSLAYAGGALHILGSVVYIGLHGERNRTKRMMLWCVFSITVAAVALLGLHLATDNPGWSRGLNVLAGLLTMLLPIFGTLFLVAESSVANESRVWSAVRKGTLPALMLATFFVVSETAQTFFSGSLGPIAGIVATAPLILLIAPIQRLGERFGHVIAPGVPQTGTAQAGNEAVYERQVRFAWTDGRIAGKERTRLIALRKDLGIDAERAESIEAAVVSDAEKRA